MKRHLKSKKQSYAYPSIIKNTPFHFVEAYNSIRTNIRFASVSKSFYKILITSSISGEGKSTVALNLAVSLANSKNRVLLVDCDLRKPTIHRYLHLDSNGSGLTTVLAGLSEIEDCILHIDELGIDVLPSGPVPPNPVELLDSSKMSQVMESLSQRYDSILLDAPPALAVSDAAVLSKLADGIVFVVRHHYTTREETRLAIDSLNKVGAVIIGTILNAFRAEKEERGGGYRYYRRYGYWDLRKPPAPAKSVPEPLPVAAIK